MLSKVSDIDLLIAFAAVHYLENASDEKQAEIINEAFTAGGVAYDHGENFPKGVKLDYRAILSTWIMFEEEAINRDLIREEYDPDDYEDFDDTYDCGCCKCCGCTCGDDYMWEDDGSFDDDDWGDDD